MELGRRAASFLATPPVMAGMPERQACPVQPVGEISHTGSGRNLTAETLFTPCRVTITLPAGVAPLGAPFLLSALPFLSSLTRFPLWPGTRPFVHDLGGIRDGSGHSLWVVSPILQEPPRQDKDSHRRSATAEPDRKRR